MNNTLELFLRTAPGREQLTSKIFFFLLPVTREKVTLTTRCIPDSAMTSLASEPIENCSDSKISQAMGGD